MTGPQVRPTTIRIDLDAIRHNVRTLRAVAGTDVCAVVKADGYGHGAVEVGRAALEAGASWLGVALVEEGVLLRSAGVTAPILLLSEPPVAGIAPLLEAQLTPVVYRSPFLAALDAAAGERGVTADVHVKADTGMGRVGVQPDAWASFLRLAAEATNLRVDGLMTHLACADEPDRPVTGEQLARFDRFLETARGLGIDPTWIHSANTAATLLHPAARRSLVRPGIGVYGLSPAPAVDAADHALRPALSLVSQVSLVKRVAAGTAVSYGHVWSAPTDGWVATVPVGYADGVPRRLTGRGEALLGGVRRPLAGTVTMDQVLVWCGEDEPAVGDEVVLLGSQGDGQLRVEDWARHLGTITYELTSQLTGRPRRTYTDGPAL